MKKGFTLAEVLITLGIIGVVAALTIPTLNVSTKEKTFDAALKVCVSDLENAFTTMMATEGVGDIEETTAFTENKIIENLKKYIKITSFSSDFCIMKNGAEVRFPNSKPSNLVNEHGETLDSADYATSLTIDINGSDPNGGKPNVKGVDIFDYAVMNTGLLEKLKL